MGKTNGSLVLVVGPSGAGKDSVLNGARAALADDDDFVFVRRTITRTSGAGGEDNVEVTPEAFAAAKATGAFALSWRAHDLDYGIPKSIEDDLRDFADRHVNLPDEELSWKCEQTIRNYDPCISCAAHFLSVDVERE